MPVALVLLAAFQVAAPSPESTTVVPGPQHAAGGLHRFLLGNTYRDLWTTPIRVPVLDLDRFAAGMTPSERGGSKQTRSLRFRTGDGRTLVFRALEKDPTQTWPEVLRESPARGLAEDQISALLPAGALAVSVLEDAVGLLHARPALYALPDDPRLGEWREEFANSLGLLEQRVRGRGDVVEAALGAREVINSETLFDRLASNPTHRVDGAAFLAARLFDLVVGDWDRHADQWSWARFDEGPLCVWRPVPRDRDWALSRLDGPLYALLRLYLPKYQSFGRRYGSVYGLTLSAEPLDRRLLVWLERPLWDSVAAALVAALDDRTIDRAVAALPREFAIEFRTELAHALRHRRDHLPEVAAAFYRQLAGVVDLHGTVRAERVVADRAADGAITITMTPADGDGPARQRRFNPGVTSEVRVYLGGGEDGVSVQGEGPERIRLRTLSGPAPTSPIAIARDWGQRWSVAPWFEASPEVGVILGGGPVLYRYRFGRQPFATRAGLRVAQATARGGLNADLGLDIRARRPDLRFLVRAAVLDLDVVRYFGYGNETARSEEGSYYRVVQRDVLFEPSVEWRPRPDLRLALGGFLRAARADLDDESLLALERPYGAGAFTLAGATLEGALDTRDLAAYPTRGKRLAASIRAAPGMFDLDRAFASARIEVSGYVTANRWPARPTLAVRAGASRVLGSAPFFEGATVGGRASVRGLSTQRFLGDGAAWAGAEVRLAAGRFTAFVPGEWGIFGLTDAGRVWLSGERSRRWHGAGGGGVWFAFLDRRSTMSVTVARSEERTRLYVRAGMHY